MYRVELIDGQTRLVSGEELGRYQGRIKAFVLDVRASDDVVDLDRELAEIYASLDPPATAEDAA